MSTQDELQQLMQSLVELEQDLDKLAVINQPDPQSFDENDEAKATSADMKSMKFQQMNIRPTEVGKTEFAAESPPNPMHRLPHELWIKICRYLSLGQLCRLSLVNTFFHGIARDPILWTELSIATGSCSTDCLVALIRRCTLLSKLSFREKRRNNGRGKWGVEAQAAINDKDVSEVLTAVADSCPRLSRLEVRYCHMPINYSLFEQLTLSCRELTYIDLELTGVLNRDADNHSRHGDINPCPCLPGDAFPGVLGQLTHLAHLHLFDCKNLNSAGLCLIADTCGDTLETLNIDMVNYLSDASMLHFISKCKNKLSTFIVDGESLSDATFAAFGDLQQLRTLKISFADNMRTAGLAGIGRLARLEALRIKRGSELLTKDFTTAFDAALSPHQNVVQLGSTLTWLDLSECSQLSDTALASIARCCPRLATLALSWCWEVSDTGVRSLFQHCRQLEHLNLCGVVRLCGDMLELIPKQLKNLKSLDLEQCPNFELDELQELLEEMPSLVIKDYYGERVYPIYCLQQILLQSQGIQPVQFYEDSDES